MINKELLSNAIKEYFVNKLENGKYEIDVVDANADIQEILDELEKDKWEKPEVSVPSDGRYILLSFENLSLPCVGRYEADEDGGGAFYFGDDGEEEGSCLQQNMIVNGWMELPKCYKEEEDVC